MWHVVVNGSAVRNPLARVVIGGLATCFALALTAGILLLVLPFVGLAVGASLGLAGAILTGVGIFLAALPVFLLLLLCVVLPFRILKALMFG